MRRGAWSAVALALCLVACRRPAAPRPAPNAPGETRRPAALGPPPLSAEGLAEALRAEPTPGVAEPRDASFGTQADLPPPPDRAAARAANNLGMKRYRARDYAGAAARFRAALSADPGFVLAHYNLACMAALLGDRDTARAELGWLATSPDPQARGRLGRAGADPDFASLRDDPALRGLLRWGALFPGYLPLGEAQVASAADAARLRRSSAGHEEACERPAFTATRALRQDLAPDAPGPESLLVSMADGAAILDGGGALLAIGWGVDCEGEQAALLDVSVGQVVPDDEPEIVVRYLPGDRAPGAEVLDVLKRRGRALVTILSAELGTERPPRDGGEAERAEAPAPLSIEGDAVRARLRGERQAQLHRWDPAAFSFR